MTNLAKNSAIIYQICNRVEPGKKMLQKIMYLITRRGVRLDLDYSIHFFGPYSAKLDNIVHILESYDKLFVDTSGSTHIIHLGSVPIEDGLEANDQAIVDYVLDNFSTRSAFELEAITTIDYVANTILNDYNNDEQIIENVQQIKGAKFTRDYLQDCLNTLRQTHYDDL